MTNKELVRNFLQQEGYKFEENGNVFHFKAQGMHLVCETDERDPMFIHIAAPVIYSLTDDAEVSREQVLAACNNLIARIKCLKIHLDKEGDVILVVEQFINTEATDISEVLDRAINVLAQGRLMFNLELNN